MFVLQEQQVRWNAARREDRRREAACHGGQLDWAVSGKTLSVGQMLGVAVMRLALWAMRRPEAATHGPIAT